jgi:DNA-binding IclR family transcriptional regulator
MDTLAASLASDQTEKMAGRNDAAEPSFEAAARSGTSRRPADGVASVTKSLGILEFVAEHGAVSARELSEILAIPLPTVYRLAQNLVRADYLIHLGGAKRSELGDKLHTLGTSLRHQHAMPDAVCQAIDTLHRSSGVAAYFALYREAGLTLAYVSDCPEHPRTRPFEARLPDAAHATAFGKIFLAGMDEERRTRYLRTHPLKAFTGATITDQPHLKAELDAVAALGIATEDEEFTAGTMRAAVPVRDTAGTIVGAVAISSSAVRMPHITQTVEHRLRDCSAQVGRHWRTGPRWEVSRAAG